MPELSFTVGEKQNFDDLAVKNFREYLQIPSVHPDVDYSKYRCRFFTKFGKLRTSDKLKLYRALDNKLHSNATWIKLRVFDYFGHEFT